MKRILKSIRYKLISLWIFKISWQSFKSWLNFKKRMFLLWWYDAPKYQKQLEHGVFLLKKGAVYQVGQGFEITDAKGKKRLRYIDNLFYNFKQNKITHRFSDKPIPGYTQRFSKK